MQALKERCSRTAGQAGKPVDVRALQERIATVLLDALSFVAPNRVGDSVRDWLARLDLSGTPPSGQAALMTKATAIATSLALFTPSTSGSVAVDRLVRTRGRLDSMDAAAVMALRQTLGTEVPDGGEFGEASGGAPPGQHSDHVDRLGDQRAWDGHDGFLDELLQPTQSADGRAGV
jgi:hypothetical protein